MRLLISAAMLMVVNVGVSQNLYVSTNIQVLSSVPVTGGSPTTLHTYPNFPAIEQIAYDGKNDRLFVYASFQGSGPFFNGIDRINTNGTGFASVLQLGTDEFVTGMVYNPADDKIYWSQQTGTGVQTIERADAANGANQEILFTDASNLIVIRGLALDAANQVLHWSLSDISGAPQGVLRSAPIPAPMASLSPTTHRTGLTNTINDIDLGFSPNEVFWAGDGLVQKALADGTGMVSTLAGSGISGLVVDRVNNRVIWTNSDTVHSADLDGSNASTFSVTDLDAPMAIDNPDLPVTIQLFSVE